MDAETQGKQRAWMNIAPERAMFISGRQSGYITVELISELTGSAAAAWQLLGDRRDIA
jgi:hypothetical protein